ncbi:glycoside hydrolase family 28 protein [Amanita thiersii Skay4041]|uniref:galacturonan 1,4-alpha-galacturonidase n=1 Tax=Amanita thiersii Skay4041 TaxID=703135 RepID=A0A2A9NI54_9AGAR|nr:glycoside hydrolase family 28 protein [Amanita thiersii Skay4041]
MSLSLTLVLLLHLTFLTSVKGAECTVSHSNGSDDSPAILQAFKMCATDSMITFERANYSAYTPITLSNLKNVTIFLNGNLNLPNNITEVQQKVNTTSNRPSTYATPWFYIQGTDVQIIGSEDFEWGRFHGFGQQWWDIGNRTLRPQLATFNVTNGLLRGLKIIKPVAWGWNLPGKNIRVENHYVDAKPDNSTRENTISFPFNTDGFNLSGQNITVDGYYGHNGDDCISVINGARDIVAQNGYCGFSSHGLSIGSLGRNGAQDMVQNVLFKNWTMDGAVYGARFKSWTGGQGLANNVTWEDITLVNVSTGIFITQNYYDQDKGARPENVNKTSTRVTNFTYRNFNGGLNSNWTDGTCISNPCWNFVQGIDGSQGVILDLYPETALNITMTHINIHPFNRPDSNANVICDASALAPGEQDTLGFKCQTGPFVATEIKTSEGLRSKPIRLVAYSTLFVMAVTLI